MDQKALQRTIAKAVRVEHDIKTDTLYLVFEITDEQFREEIRRDWMKDVEVKIIGKTLVKP